MTDPRRLRAHKATATCCIASRDRPGLVATSGEMDVFAGSICGVRMCCLSRMWGIILSHHYVSSQAASWKILESYNYNKEEINQIACNSSSYFLAAADDGGDVKVCLTWMVEAVQDNV